MPLRPLVFLLSVVIAAASLTIWALSLSGTGFLVAALPLFTLAVLALWLRRE